MSADDLDLVIAEQNFEADRRDYLETMTSDGQLQKLKDARTLAAPGKLHLRESVGDFYSYMIETDTEFYDSNGNDGHRVDSHRETGRALIEAFNNLPGLIAGAEHLRAENEKLRADYEKANAACIDAYETIRARDRRIAELEQPKRNRFDCIQCGHGIAVDEDGCCATCGFDAIPFNEGLPCYDGIVSAVNYRDGELSRVEEKRDAAESELSKLRGECERLAKLAAERADQIWDYGVKFAATEELHKRELQAAVAGKDAARERGRRAFDLLLSWRDTGNKPVGLDDFIREMDLEGAGAIFESQPARWQHPAERPAPALAPTPEMRAAHGCVHDKQGVTIGCSHGWCCVDCHRELCSDSAPAKEHPAPPPTGDVNIIWPGDDDRPTPPDLDLSVFGIYDEVNTLRADNAKLAQERDTALQAAADRARELKEAIADAVHERELRIVLDMDLQTAQADARRVRETAKALAWLTPNRVVGYGHGLNCPAGDRQEPGPCECIADEENAKRQAALDAIAALAPAPTPAGDES